MQIKRMPICNECGSDVLSIFAHAEWSTDLDQWVMDEIEDDHLVFCQECGTYREFEYIRKEDLS